jgi:hypothetical protein
MKTYTVTAEDSSTEVLVTIRAESYQAAARAAARKLHGRRAFAERLSGSPGVSGVFQAFVSNETLVPTKVGDPFHVSEDAHPSAIRLGACDPARGMFLAPMRRRYS